MMHLKGPENENKRAGKQWFGGNVTNCVVVSIILGALFTIVDFLRVLPFQRLSDMHGSFITFSDWAFGISLGPSTRCTASMSLIKCISRKTA
ncbi:hypothetical protein IF2G_06185 [Cordyceps javanica]|nr:hypothetical protein IF2G_06185 [Cordyceps javanica]